MQWESYILLDVVGILIFFLDAMRISSSLLPGVMVNLIFSSLLGAMGILSYYSAKYSYEC